MKAKDISLTNLPYIKYFNVPAYAPIDFTNQDLENGIYGIGTAVLASQCQGLPINDRGIIITAHQNAFQYPTMIFIPTVLDYYGSIYLRGTDSTGGIQTSWKEIPIE